MLFIGRGLVLGLTGGKTIAYELKAARIRASSRSARPTRCGFNNQILRLRARRRSSAASCWPRPAAGYETYAVGGNELAAELCRHRHALGAHPRLRARRACARRSAGLMNVAQDKGVTSQYGQGAELIVIAAVIVGGASILGGRGRVLGLVPRRHPRRAHRQGAARGHPDHPHDQGRRQRDGGAGHGPAAPGRGAGLPRPDPARRRADRALGHPPQAAPAPAGPPARHRPPPGRRRRRRDRGAAHPRHATSPPREFSATRPALAG